MLRKRRRQGFDFYRVAQRCAGAVRFDISQRARVDAGAVPRCANHLGLRFGIGGRHGHFRMPVVIDGTRPDNGHDAVAVVHRVGQTFQQHNSRSFAAHVAVCIAVECSDHALRR